jgi:hypothetical protein
LALRPSSTTNSGDPADRKALPQDGFLREVDDALREEQLVESFKRHGKTVGAAVALGLAGLAGYLWWGNTTKAAQGANSERLASALDQVERGQLDAGLRAVAPLSKDSSGTGIAARMLHASVLQQQGKADDAAREFAAVAADSSAPQPFRDLALLRETSIRFDKLQPQLVVDRMKPLAVPGKPWFGTAGELTAMAYLRLGKNDTAGALFAQIAKDAKAPESLRARARQMAGFLGVDAVDDVAKAAGVEDESAWAARPAAVPGAQPAPPPQTATPAQQ